jgi:hypothetical protein
VKNVLVLWLPVLTLAMAVCCTSPVSTESTAAADISFVIVFTPEGDGSSFSATIEGQTYTAPGAVSVSLAPGPHALTGTFDGSGFSVGFQTIGQGGVVSGSVRTTSGPSAKTSACSVTYSNDTPSVRRDFEVSFELDAEPARACPGPVV